MEVNRNGNAESDRIRAIMGDAESGYAEVSYPVDSFTALSPPDRRRYLDAFTELARGMENGPVLNGNLEQVLSLRGATFSLTMPDGVVQVRVTNVGDGQLREEYNVPPSIP